MASTPDRHRRPTPQIARGGGLSGAGFLVATLLTVAFGVGIVVGGYLMFAPQRSADVSQAVLSATGHIDPNAAPAVVDDGSWTDADLQDCKSQSIAAGDAARARRLAAVSTNRVGLGAPDPQVVEHATYLLCGATHKPQHLCNDYWRQWLIDAIRSYAVEFRQVSSSGYWNKVEIAEQAQRDGRPEWKAILDSLDQTTRDVAKMHQDIVTAFRARIEDGIIAPDDFGKFFGLGIPPDIGAMIGDAHAVRHVCS